jgi:hypothetical protein
MQWSALIPQIVSIPIGLGSLMSFAKDLYICAAVGDSTRLRGPSISKSGETIGGILALRLRPAKSKTEANL